MATKNAILSRTGDLTIDPGASGDSFVQFDINTTGEFRIGVDDTDDSFRISQGSALGTNDTFVMTAAGERTMPLQPAFLVYSNSSQNNVTGNAVRVTVAFNTKVFDQNNDFNTGTFKFTAPITGRYFIFFSVRSQGYLAGFTSLTTPIITSNADYFIFTVNPGLYFDAANEIRYDSNLLIDMDSADTVMVTLNVTGGAKVIDIYGGNDRDTVFGGYLVA